MYIQYIYIYICIYSTVHHVCIYVQKYVYTVYTYIYIILYNYICIHLHICIYTHISYIYIDTCLYIYIHITIQYINIHAQIVLLFHFRIPSGQPPTASPFGLLQGSQKHRQNPAPRSTTGVGVRSRCQIK